ncbi:MAG: hypothetical protein WC058_03275 [Phycisphaeraceae bacterium]
MTNDDDLQGTRQVIEQVTTKFNIYFFCIMAFLGGCVFIAGLVQLEFKAPAALENIPEPALLIAVGMVAFSLFFPIFMAIYFARHFLVRVKRLEHENRELREKLDILLNNEDAVDGARR